MIQKKTVCSLFRLKARGHRARYCLRIKFYSIGYKNLAVFFYVPDSIFLQMVPLLYVLVLSLFGSVFVTALMIILDTKVKNQH